LKLSIKYAQRLFELPPRERWLLAQAWLLLLTTDLALRLLPFTSVLEYCRRQNVRPADPVMGLPLPTSRLAWLVEKAGQHCPAGTSCLKEALVLSWLMARSGLPTTLRIGVGRHNGSFAAHAWLEQDGRIVLGRPGSDAYAPMTPLHR